MSRDWADFFVDELADADWTVVTNRWLPRLAPGMVGGMHGAIRSAHAVRSVGRTATPERVQELAEGLGYWAAQYEELARDNSAPKQLRPSEAIAVLEQLSLSDRTGWSASRTPWASSSTFPRSLPQPTSSTRPSPVSRSQILR